MYKIEDKDGNLRAGKIISNKSTQWIVSIILIATIFLGALTDWIAASYLGAAIIIAVLIFNAAIIVPTVYFGIPTRFKKRIKDSKDEVVPIKEGLHFIFPIIDDLLPENLKSRKLTTQEVKVSALSQDKLEITIEGSVQYKPDNLNTYIEMAQKTITDGMVDAIESEVGRICGTSDANTFVDNRAQVERLIQCALILKRAPHYYINIFDASKADSKLAETKKGAKKLRSLLAKEDFTGSDSDYDKFLNSPDILKAEGNGNKRFIMGVILKELSDKSLFDDIKKRVGNKEIQDYVDKLSSENWDVKLENEGGEIDKIAFYKDNADRISLLFKIENEIEKRQSHVEKLYGVKVATFRLSGLNFSKSAQDAFEEKRSTKAKMEAADIRLEKKIGMLRKYIEAGLSPTEAVNMVETTAGVEGINRQIVSVEGSQSADLLAFAKILAGNKGGDKL